jgi:archaellum component FlaC
VWHKTKWLKRYEDDLDNKSDYYDASIRAYQLAVKDITKEFNRIDNSVENQRKIVNGWEHKIAIMDREIRKIKKELSEQKE